MKLELSRSELVPDGQMEWYEVNLVLKDLQLSCRLTYVVHPENEHVVRKIGTSWKCSGSVRTEDVPDTIRTAEKMTTTWMESIPWYDFAVLEIPDGIQEVENGDSCRKNRKIVPFYCRKRHAVL